VDRIAEVSIRKVMNAGPGRLGQHLQKRPPIPATPPPRAAPANSV
jgi:hypothetical protein